VVRNPVFLEDRVESLAFDSNASRGRPGKQVVLDERTIYAVTSVDPKISESRTVADCDPQDGQSPTLDIAGKTIPDRFGEFRIRFNRHDTETLSQIKLRIFSYVHADIVDQVLDHDFNLSREVRITILVSDRGRRQLSTHLPVLAGYEMKPREGQKKLTGLR